MVEMKKPRLTLERSVSGHLFIGLDEYGENGFAVRSCVLSSGRGVDDEVMRKRFRTMAGYMPGVTPTVLA